MLLLTGAELVGEMPNIDLVPRVTLTSTSDLLDQLI